MTNVSREAAFELVISRRGNLPPRFEIQPEDDAPTNSQVVETLYRWEPGGEDPLGSLQAGAAAEFRRKLLDRFALGMPADDRTVSKFRHAVTEVVASTIIREGMQWSERTVPIRDRAGDDIHPRINGAAMLLMHFLWVANIYADIPEATVLIQ